MNMSEFYKNLEMLVRVYFNSGDTPVLLYTIDIIDLTW